MKGLKDIRIIPILLAVSFLIFFFYSWYKGEQEVSERKNNKIIGKGQITKIHGGYKSSTSITYEYFYNGIKYERETSILLVYREWEESKILNRYFPVVLSSKNPENSTILVTSGAFEFYDIQMPDSLLWVKELE